MLSTPTLLSRHLLRRAWLAPRRAQELLARERWSAERLAERQAELLRASVLAARSQLPAHAELPEPPTGLALFDWLRREVPLLDKRTLQQDRSRHYPNGGQRRPWWPSGKTSGSSGSPLEVFRSLNAVIWEEAFHLQTWQWTGWRPGQAQAVLRGDAVAPPSQSQPPFWTWDPFGRQLFLSSRHLKPQHAQVLLKALADSGAQMLRAYPSTAYALAQLAEQQGWATRVPALVTGSEPLYPLQREQIERSLATRVFDSYGMAERVAFAAQCEHGFHHLHPEYAWVEILDARGAPTADFGQVVGSSFHNLVMPLLRYRLADQARWLPGQCACGRSYPRIELASGKVEDQLFDLDGHPVSASVITFAFKGLSYIRQSQVAQTEAQHWVVRLVPDAGFTESDGQALLGNLHHRVSERLQVSLQIVDEIPRQASGKFKWVAQEWAGAREQVAPGEPAMKQPYMCGTDPGGQGGIAAVLSVYQRQGWMDGHQVRFLATHRAGGASRWLPIYLLALARLFQALLLGRVAVLHAHVASRGSFMRKSLMLALARAFGVPTVFHLHGAEFQQFVAAAPAPLGAWIRHSLARSTRVLALSDAWRSYLQQLEPAARVEVLANPVDLPGAKPWRGEATRLLFLGRAEQRKGVFDLLQAVAQLRPRHPQLRLAIGGDGDLLALRAAIIRLGLDEVVELLGWVRGERKTTELSRAGVFVLPSYNEGLPMAMLEAMAASLPVVSTPVGGIPQALRDGQEGLLVQPGDVAALAATLERLLLDPVLARRLGDAARERVAAQYATERVLARLDAIYADMGLARK